MQHLGDRIWDAEVIAETAAFGRGDHERRGHDPADGVAHVRAQWHGLAHCVGAPVQDRVGPAEVAVGEQRRPLGLELLPVVVTRRVSDVFGHIDAPPGGSVTLPESQETGEKAYPY